jgi:predicted RNase H-like HicB family nuclease
MAANVTLENRTLMAIVKDLLGVIATGKTFEDCLQDLIEVIEEWVTIRLQRGLDMPPLYGHTIGISEEPMVVV